MNTKDVKIGETYLLPVTVTTIEKCGWIEAGTCNDYEYRLAPSEVKTLLPNGTKNTETAPKYDPCRLFRKGDKVRLKEHHGRKAVMYSGTNSWFNHHPSYKNGILVVKEDEKESMVEIGIITADCAHATTLPCYLELVTPIEEAEPFYITRDDEDGCYFVKRDDGETTAVDTLVQAFYFKTEDYSAHYYTEEQAKKLANEACNRLNAEYRKENDHA